MFAVRVWVAMTAAMLSLEGCAVPPERCDPPVVPQGPVMEQAPPAAWPANAWRRPEDPLYEAYVAQRRKTHPAGQWQSSPESKWATALFGYEPRVKPRNQRALDPRRGPFGPYLIHIHNRIHPIFAEEFVAWLDTLPPNDPRNQSQLVVRIEVAMSGADGHIVHMGVFRSSGVASFDVGALETFEEAAPFGPPPAGLLSSDGNAYFHWELHRDPTYGCSTVHARPFLISAN
jgi:hypothetical protein